MANIQCTRKTKLLGAVGLIVVLVVAFTIPLVLTKSISKDDGGPPAETTTASSSSTPSTTASGSTGTSAASSSSSPPPPTTTLAGEEEVPEGPKPDQARFFMRRSGISAFLIPSDDAHQSEYVGQSDRRVEYMTGFTGSNGYAIVTSDSAALWVDSRYHLQADKQVDPSVWTIMKMGRPEVPSRTDWLKSVLKSGDVVGFDPYLTSMQEFQTTQTALREAGIEMAVVDQNIVDLVWERDEDEKPEPNITPLNPLGIQYSGKLVKDKLELVKADLNKDAEAVVLTALDEIAWFFNLRANDITNTPVFYAYALVSRSNGSWLFVHDNRITSEIKSHFEDEGVEVKVESYGKVTDGIKEFLDTIPGKILVPTASGYAINQAVPDNRKISGSSPVSGIKAVKNDVEAHGLQVSHIRDGAALVRYLHWLEENVGKENITEISGAEVLARFRHEQLLSRGLSFNSISASGPNAAVVHYRANEETNRQITTDEVYLIDSGGQYFDGTTDVTRTIHLGEPSDFIRECFTRVLKGYIAVHRAVFPARTNGAVFDTLARQHLWQIGLDYGHGTGHGIGAYLGVHEYPPSFGQGNRDAIVKNMFVSNEPGFYQAEEFGIRIEDIVQVVEAKDSRFNFDDKGALRIQPVTLAPLQQKMIDVKLLNGEEIDWINEYHKQVLDKVGSLLREQGHRREYDWLVVQTLPLKK